MNDLWEAEVKNRESIKAYHDAVLKAKELKAQIET
jgi:hypothetical protein